jgi:hypothetical protein
MTQEIFNNNIRITAKAKPDLFQGEGAFRLLAHYVNANSSNVSLVKDEFNLSAGTFERWLIGVSTPPPMARSIIANRLFDFIDVGVTAMPSSHHKQALAKIFQESAADFTDQTLFWLAFNVANSYDPLIGRKFADDYGLSYSTITRYIQGRAVPQLFARSRVIQGLGVSLAA